MLHTSPWKTPSPEAPRLLACLRQDRHLVARCVCGRVSTCDPLQWITEGLGGEPLWRFESRLRCVCGARQARLEIAVGPYAPSPKSGIYVFR